VVLKGFSPGGFSKGNDTEALAFIAVGQLGNSPFHESDRVVAPLGVWKTIIFKVEFQAIEDFPGISEIVFMYAEVFYAL
jgi:hypothetical protein